MYSALVINNLISGGCRLLYVLFLKVNFSYGKTESIYYRFFGISFFILFAISLNSQIWINNLEDSVYSSQWINLQIVDSNLAHSGNHYSVADTIQYGMGIESQFPESIKNKNTLVKISGWVMSDTVFDQASFVISMGSEQQQYFWKGINLSPLLQEDSQWYFFSDSVVVPANVTGNAIFKAYLWNSDVQNTIALDDLRIEFKEIANPSFIPVVPAVDLIPLSSSEELIFANPFYKMFYNSVREQLFIASTKQKLFINRINYYVETVIKSDTVREFLPLKLKTIKKNRNEFQLVFMSKSTRSKIKIVFVCNLFKPEVKVLTEINNKAGQYIIRESLVMNYRQPLTEVYRANRKTDREIFITEYWLDRQGIQTGSGKNTMVVYHQPGISSLQVNKVKKQLWVNFDYEKDHPFLHFPLLEDSTDYIQDWSAYYSKKKSKSMHHLTISFGIPANGLPRFMKNPKGYLSTYIWTEHADFTNIRTNRATYFGSESIEKTRDAIGGFARYNIPVTKSVFYHNPDGITNSEISNGVFTEAESTISDTSFLSFLKEIEIAGSEICLHTPEQFTTKREYMEEALDYMSNEFSSATWIDHGYNNKLHNNREDLVCDGSLKKSNFYFADLWQQFGTKYFWNPYYEDFQTFPQWQFNNFLNKPYPGYGDFLPNPSWWKHTSRTGELIHWPTKSVLYVPEDHLWDFYFNDLVLKAFVDSWDVEINHCYPAWVDPEKGFWVYDEDSTIVAAPGLNRTLERMSMLREEGKLNVTTIDKFLDHQLALENIVYELLPDGRIKVTNQNSSVIHALSFATSSKQVFINGLIPEQKQVDEDLIFWFDLDPFESKVIRTISDELF